MELDIGQLLSTPSHTLEAALGPQFEEKATKVSGVRAVPAAWRAWVEV